MTKSVTATEARVRFGELLRGVTEREETVVVERGGKPAAVVVSFAVYQQLKPPADPPAWHAALERARAVRMSIKRDSKGRALPPPEEMIAAARGTRDDELGGRR